MISPESAQAIFISGLLAFAAYRDVKTREIPDLISVLTALSFLFRPEPGNLWGLLAAAVIFSIALATGKIGGGDVKLITALSLACGLRKILLLLFTAQLSMLIFYGIAAAVQKVRGKTADKALPFVPFIALGYIVTIIV